MQNKQALFTSVSGVYITPEDLYKKLDFYYKFHTDPCTTDENPLNCRVFFTKKTNGLDYRKWVGNVYINPEYGKNINDWITQVQLYTLFNKQNTVVMLLPSRTDTIWFHRLLDMSNTKIHFISGRLKFRNTKHPAPFPSVLVFINDRSIETTTNKLIVDF